MPIDNELVYRIAKTPQGVKVTARDGRGLADGVFVKRQTRYFYGDDAEVRAEQYAEKKADGEADRRVVALGERVNE
jgi:hypothetical protein